MHFTGRLQTKNSYLSEGAPIGVHRISVRGSSKALKTVVVDYGWVEEVPLTVMAHNSLNWRTNDAKDALEDATNRIFLKDGYPRGGSIRSRYEDERDRNCPIALVLGGFGSFTDTAVKPDAEQDRYLEINNAQEFAEITSNWTDTHIIVFRGAFYHPDIGGTLYEVSWARGHYGGLDAHIFMSENVGDFGETLGHEFGHYYGHLDDLVECEVCGGTYTTCVCTCPNRLKRGECTCGHQFPHVGTIPEYVHNL